MQKITVEITAKGYTGLTAENIEKALDYYFGSRSLKVSFSVKEAVQQMRASDGLESPAKKSVFTAEIFRPAKKRKVTSRA